MLATVHKGQPCGTCGVCAPKKPTLKIEAKWYTKPKPKKGRAWQVVPQVEQLAAGADDDEEQDPNDLDEDEGAADEDPEPPLKKKVRSLATLSVDVRADLLPQKNVHYDGYRRPGESSTSSQASNEANGEDDVVADSQGCPTPPVATRPSASAPLAIPSVFLNVGPSIGPADISMMAQAGSPSISQSPSPGVVSPSPNRSFGHPAAVLFPPQPVTPIKSTQHPVLHNAHSPDILSALFETPQGVRTASAESFDYSKFLNFGGVHTSTVIGNDDELQRIAEEEKKQAAKQQEEEQRLAEEKSKAEEVERQRLADEERERERQRRLAEEIAKRRLEEERRLAEEQRRAEEERQRQEREEEERKKIEQDRLEHERNEAIRSRRLQAAQFFEALPVVYPMGFDSALKAYMRTHDERQFMLAAHLRKLNEDGADPTVKGEVQKEFEAHLRTRQKAYTDSMDLDALEGLVNACQAALAKGL